MAEKLESVDFDYAVHTENLWRIYKIGNNIEVPALRGLNLDIEPGHFIALKGRSGSGKTTLLNCLSGLDQPTSGTVKVLGRDLTEMNDRQLTQWRREQLGFVFQSFGLAADAVCLLERGVDAAHQGGRCSRATPTC